MEKEIYLIADGNTNYDDLFVYLKVALMGGVDKVLVSQAEAYNDFENTRIIELCHNYEAEAFIYNDESFAHEQDCDGVHFKSLPTSFKRNDSKDDFIYGVSVSSNMEDIQQIIEAKVDYIALGNILTPEVGRKSLQEISSIINDVVKSYDIPVYVAVEPSEDIWKPLISLPIKGIIIKANLSKPNIESAYFMDLKAKLNTNN